MGSGPVRAVTKERKRASKGASEAVQRASERGGLAMKGVWRALAWRELQKHQRQLERPLIEQRGPQRQLRGLPSS